VPRDRPERPDGLVFCPLANLRARAVSWRGASGEASHEPRCSGSRRARGERRGGRDCPGPVLPVTGGSQPAGEIRAAGVRHQGRPFPGERSRHQAECRGGLGQPGQPRAPAPGGPGGPGRGHHGQGAGEEPGCLVFPGPHRALPGRPSGSGHGVCPG